MGPIYHPSPTPRHYDTYKNNGQLYTLTIKSPGTLGYTDPTTRVFTGENKTMFDR